MGSVRTRARRLLSGGTLSFGMLALAAGVAGCPQPIQGQDATFEIHSFGPTGPILFSDTLPYADPSHSIKTYTAAQLGVAVTQAGPDTFSLAEIYSNTLPTFDGQNEVILFDRDPDEAYDTFASDLNQDPTSWDNNVKTQYGVTLPNAFGMVYPTQPTNPPKSEQSITSVDFLGGNPNFSLRGPAGDPHGDGSVKSAYIVRHGTCSKTKPIQDNLSQITMTLYDDIQSKTGIFGSAFFSNPTVNYVHTVAWMTEGGHQVDPTSGGFILGLYISDFSDELLNITYTWTLDTQGPWNGILTVNPSENNSSSTNGVIGSTVLGQLRDPLEAAAHGSGGLVDTVEQLAFAQQSAPVPNGSGGNLPCNGAPPDGSAPDEPFRKTYCPLVAIPMGAALTSGETHLNINPKYDNYISNTLFSEFGDGQYWSNFRCNAHPTYSDVPTCEVMARASRVVAYPDAVELVFFDRTDGGGLTDFSGDAPFADGTLYSSEGFALFVALNNTITSRTPNFSALCDGPIQTLSVFHPYAHAEIPGTGSGGGPVGGAPVPASQVPKVN